MSLEFSQIKKISNHYSLLSTANVYSHQQGAVKKEAEKRGQDICIILYAKFQFTTLNAIYDIFLSLLSSRVRRRNQRLLHLSFVSAHVGLFSAFLPSDHRKQRQERSSVEKEIAVWGPFPPPAPLKTSVGGVGATFQTPSVCPTTQVADSLNVCRMQESGCTLSGLVLQ